MNEALLHYLTIFTTAVSILSLWLGVKQRLATFPVTICITLLNMVVYYYQERYDRCFSGVASIAMSCYAWYQWRYGGQGGKPLVRMRVTTLKEGLAVLLVGLPCWYLFWQLLALLGSQQHLWGSVNGMLVFLGLWMTAGKRVETYPVWFLVNIISVRNNYMVGNPIFAFKYAIYLVVSIYGSHVWWAQYQGQRKARIEP